VRMRSSSRRRWGTATTSGRALSWSSSTALSGALSSGARDAAHANSPGNGPAPMSIVPNFVTFASPIALQMETRMPTPVPREVAQLLHDPPDDCVEHDPSLGRSGADRARAEKDAGAAGRSGA
jgi:hypothetical protein